ncbi:Hypothetical_protein [Hexamita inflata]|uniref:Hypothetical_protein n=1 Tax=Hexamita inflata TaxID=28002 RepID=A0AA86UXC9_9EUKA|nr:Hypothetical protein HINF_LOCUS59414 [Hexamita inflata]CAI9971771.1 Hypothetical protein HINF_LOCUS59416 [Hexamita inflata]CAI9971784.1 Hypothetical protein HINF_LOCUS59429 [Hexamita inflata]
MLVVIFAMLQPQAKSTFAHIITFFKNSQNGTNTLDVINPLQMLYQQEYPVSLKSTSLNCYISYISATIPEILSPSNLNYTKLSSRMSTDLDFNIIPDKIFPLAVNIS